VIFVVIGAILKACGRKTCRAQRLIREVSCAKARTLNADLEAIGERQVPRLDHWKVALLSHLFASNVFKVMAGE